MKAKKNLESRESRESKDFDDAGNTPDIALPDLPTEYFVLYVASAY